MDAGVYKISEHCQRTGLIIKLGIILVESLKIQDFDKYNFFLTFSTKSL